MDSMRIKIGKKAESKDEALKISERQEVTSEQFKGLAKTVVKTRLFREAINGASNILESM